MRTADIPEVHYKWCYSYVPPLGIVRITFIDVVVITIRNNWCPELGGFVIILKWIDCLSNFLYVLTSIPKEREIKTLKGIFSVVTVVASPREGVSYMTCAYTHYIHVYSCHAPVDGTNVQETSVEGGEGRRLGVGVLVSMPSLFDKVEERIPSKAKIKKITCEPRLQRIVITCLICYLHFIVWYLDFNLIYIHPCSSIFTIC